MIELSLRAKCERVDKMSVTSGMFELVASTTVRAVGSAIRRLD